MVLPLISICDEIVFDDIWEQVFSRKQNFTSTAFSEVLKMVQDRLECLGITCSMVGRHLEYGDTWPECVDNAASNRLELAGYSPATDDSLSVSVLRCAHNASSVPGFSLTYSPPFPVVKN